MLSNYQDKNNKYMKQYLDVLQKILDEGVEKESGRANNEK